MALFILKKNVRYTLAFRIYKVEETEVFGETNDIFLNP